MPLSRKQETNKKRTGLLPPRTIKPHIYAPPITSTKNTVRKYLNSNLARYQRIQKSTPELALQRISELKTELSLLENGALPLSRYKLLLQWAKEQKIKQRERVGKIKLVRAARKP